MTTDQPILFLDVDGVLNRFALQRVAPVDGEPWLRTTTAQLPGMADPVPLVMDPADAGRIRSMAAVTEVVWGTTWNEHANTVIAPLLGIDPMPVASMRKRFSEYDATAMWKWRHAIDYARGRPFAWIDDGFTLSMIGLAERRTERGVPTLLLTASPSVGLTDEMVADVMEFADVVARAGKTGSAPA